MSTSPTCASPPGTGRSHFEHRAALVVDSVEGAREGLAELAENRPRPGVVRGEHTHQPTTAWLFTGQGSQYPGMARELFDAEPVFAETVTRCADAVDGHAAASVAGGAVRHRSRNRWRAGETLRHTSFAQPALFAVEMGLARLWQSWGIEPDVVLGHSVGQYAAACVAGVFSLEDGARLMAERGRLFGSLPEGGRMVAVFADAKHVEDVADEFPRVSVGAYNGPNTVLSGPGEDLEQIVASMQRRRRSAAPGWRPATPSTRSCWIRCSMNSSRTQRSCEFAAPTLPLVCNRTGAVLTAQTPLDAPVLAAAFPPAGAVRRKCAHRGGAGLLGVDGDRSATGADRGRGAGLAGAPGRAAGDRLAAQGRRRPAPDRRRAGRGLRRRPPARFRCAASPARVADSNCPPIRSSAAASGPRRPASPAPIGRLRYPESWAAQRISPPATSVYTSRLSVKSQPWLSDHVIYGTVVVPGATYAAMALAAVGPPARVKDVFFYEPIILPEKSSREVQLTLHPLEDGGDVELQGAQPPIRCSRCRMVAERRRHRRHRRLRRHDEPAPEQSDPIDAAIERLNRMRPQELFETFADMELAWGPTWSGSLKSLWLGEGEAIGDITRRRRTRRTPRNRADASGADGPVHRRRLPGVPGAARGRAGRERPVPAVAVRAGDAAGEDASAVLLPREVARQRPRQRNPGLRPRFRRSGWPPPRRNSRVHRQTRASRGVVARARRRCHPAAVHPWLARGAARLRGE